MKTPLTDKLSSAFADDECASFADADFEMLVHARCLELDRAALMDALEKIANRYVIAGSTGDYRQGQLDALSSCREVAESALAAARANFPEQH
jgi:hypothetical protein